MKNFTRLNLKGLLIIITIIFCVPSFVAAQLFESKGGLNLGFSFLLTEVQQFRSPDISPFRMDVILNSKGNKSFEGHLEYYRKINDRFEATVGIFTGVYPIDYQIFTDSTFSQTENNLYFYFVDRRSANYYGLSLSLGYNMPIGQKQMITISGGVNYVFFTPSFYSSTFTVLTDTSRLKIFELKAEINSAKKAFIAPELSVRYQYKIGKRFAPYIALSGVISKNKPIIGTKFVLYGKDETLEGTFTKRFIHVSAELGVRYAFKSK